MLKDTNNKILMIIPLALVCMLLSGLFLPVYSDEIVTKFYMARFFLENEQMLSFFPQCTTSVGHHVAWVFYPAAILISSIYAYLEPFGLRVSGVILALIWFTLLAYWCFRQSPEGWVERFTLLIGCAALGVMPYLWVLSRPEQFMYLPILLISIAALYLPPQRGAWRQIALAGLFGLLVSIFFYAHPKSLFFTPFCLAAAWITTREFKTFIRASLCLYVIALAAQVLRNNILLGSCQDAPAVQAILAANTLMPGMLLNAPVAFVIEAIHNIIQFPERMLTHLTFSPSFQSGWLPPIATGTYVVSWLNILIHYTLFSLVIGSHLLALGLATVNLLRRRLSIALLLAALLAMGDLINIALYKLQNFYAGIQYIPLSIIITLLLFRCLPDIRSYGTTKVAQRILLCYVVSLSLASLITLLYLVTPNLLRNSNYTNASLPGQYLSVPVFGVNAHIESILELGKLCHLPTENAEHLVVDHMTYFAYLKNKNPVHVLYVSELGYGGDLLNGKLLPFLKKRNSPGLITRCEWVPKDLRELQQQNDRGYCCIDFNGK